MPRRWMLVVLLALPACFEDDKSDDDDDDDDTASDFGGGIGGGSANGGTGDDGSATGGDGSGTGGDAGSGSASGTGGDAGSGSASGAGTGGSYTLEDYPSALWVSISLAGDDFPCEGSGITVIENGSAFAGTASCETDPLGVIETEWSGGITGAVATGTITAELLGVRLSFPLEGQFQGELFEASFAGEESGATFTGVIIGQRSR